MNFLCDCLCPHCDFRIKKGLFFGFSLAHQILCRAFLLSYITYRFGNCLAVVKYNYLCGSHVGLNKIFQS